MNTPHTQPFLTPNPHSLHNHPTLPHAPIHPKHTSNIHPRLTHNTRHPTHPQKTPHTHSQQTPHTPRLRHTPPLTPSTPHSPHTRIISTAPSTHGLVAVAPWVTQLVSLRRIFHENCLRISLFSKNVKEDFRINPSKGKFPLKFLWQSVLYCMLVHSSSTVREHIQILQKYWVFFARQPE
jgi:hypothetical protein